MISKIDIYRLLYIKNKGINNLSHNYLMNSNSDFFKDKLSNNSIDKSNEALFNSNNSQKYSNNNSTYNNKEKIQDDNEDQAKFKIYY